MRMEEGPQPTVSTRMTVQMWLGAAVGRMDFPKSMDGRPMQSGTVPNVPAARDVAASPQGRVSDNWKDSHFSTRHPRISRGHLYGAAFDPILLLNPASGDCGQL